MIEMPTVLPELEIETRTEHPYIVRTAGVCGGRSIIRGSRIAVWQIAWLFKAGETMDEIALDYPHLSPASIYDAISYYLDHQAEIEQDIAENHIETLLAQPGVTMDKRGFLHFANRPQITDEHV
jgi:uncharacterized protein (DUF433 family)